MHTITDFRKHDVPEFFWPTGRAMEAEHRPGWHARIVETPHVAGSPPAGASGRQLKVSDMWSTGL